MAKYKMHLLSHDGRIVGEKAFNAVRNYEAVEIAERLAQEAAGCSAYELWRGDRKVARRAAPRRAHRA